MYQLIQFLHKQKYITNNNNQKEKIQKQQKNINTIKFNIIKQIIDK